MSEDSSTSTPGDRVGELLSERYRIDALLGEGAMGLVYRGEHTMMKKPVAIKVLHAELSDHAEIAQRFQREAQAAGHIDHPNVCAATDFGRTKAGELFMVMEFIDGRTLTDAIEEHGALSVRRTVAIGRQLCDALEAAHALGIVHRDLKPDNVMLMGDASDERVKVMDFGVASVQLEGSEDAKLTRAGAVYGTPAFMAPEQVVGSEIGPRTDLYALGIVLYQCLTGSLPFEGGSVTQIMGLQLTAEPPELPGYVPPQLATLVMSMLAKEREDRPESAAAVRDALGAPHDVAATMIAPPAEPAAASNRGPLLVAGAIVALVLVALMIAVGILSSRSATEQAIETQALASGKSVEEVSLDASRNAFAEANGINALLEALARGEHEQAEGLLAKLDEAHADSPHLAYYRGMAAVGAKKLDSALTHYGRAIELDARYAHDTTLIEDALGALGAKSKKTRAGAEAFVEARLSEVEALDERLGALVRESSSRRTRKAAWELVEKRGRVDALSPVTRIGAELRMASSCSARKKLVVEATELGDARLLSDVERYHKAKKTGCGMLKLEDCHKCMRSELGRARKALSAAEGGR